MRTDRFTNSRKLRFQLKLGPEKRKRPSSFQIQLNDNKSFMWFSYSLRAFSMKSTVTIFSSIHQMLHLWTSWATHPYPLLLRVWHPIRHRAMKSRRQLSILSISTILLASTSSLVSHCLFNSRIPFHINLTISIYYICDMYECF